MALEAFITILSLGVLWVFICWLYRDYRDDAFRQNLFELRDELFDLAASRQVGFDHPAYGLLRSTIHGFMFNAEKVSLTALFIFSFAGAKPELREAGRRFGERWDSALNSLPGETKAKLVGIRERLNFNLVTHIVSTSPIVWVLIVPLLVAALLTLMTAAVREPVQRLLVRHCRIEEFDVVGATLGDDSEPATAAA